jgi:hypothetical protein
VDFREVAKGFINAFNQKDISGIQGYIDPEIGFFVLDNPGAAVIPEYFNNYDQIVMLDDGYGVARLNQMDFSCNILKPGRVPVFSCEMGTWDVEGCFYGKSGTPKIEEIYNLNLEYEFIDKMSYESSINNAIKIDRLITHFIYSTDSTSGFYFGIINGKWRLLCIDIVAPCSA